MKRLLTSLILPVLCLATPAALSQVVADAAPAADTAAGSSSANPAENIAPLYPEKIIKKRLKMKEGRAEILPYGLISSGQAALVLSGLSDTRNGMKQDIVISSSKDGSSWDRAAIVLPQLNLHFISTTGMGAIYDSIRNQVVLLYCEPTSYKQYKNAKKKGEEANLNENSKFFISFGKGGKFSKPKDITKQFDAKRRTQEDFRIEGHGLQFQGLCLTKGEHRGRLLFLACVADKTMCSIYSDDHGRTWKVGDGIVVKRASAYGIGNGLNLAQADDGSVVSYLNPEGQQAHWLYSNDGGATWVEKTSQPGVVTSTPGVWSNAYIVLNSADGEGNGSRLLAVSTLDKDKGLTHVALSYDWGVTWPHRKVIESALLVTRNNLPVQPIGGGRIGLITTSVTSVHHPDNGMGNAGFTSFSLSWLTDGKDDGIDEEEAPAEGEAAE